ALIAARLNDDERHHAYARIVARLLVSEIHPPMDAKMEYAGAHWTASREEREEDAMVQGLAGALVDARLDAAPRPLYDDVPKLTFAFTPRTPRREPRHRAHLLRPRRDPRRNLIRAWGSRRVRHMGEALYFFHRSDL